MLPVFYWKVVVSDNRYLEVLSYGSQWIKPEEVIDILLSEHVLRELKQREEALNYRIVAFQKAKEIQSEDDSELENANKQLKETRSKVPMKEHALYRAVSMLDSYFKGVHDNLRRDSQWFMRNDMVQDCADRGGCCSRACGCCSQRHQCHGGKGIGHCTTECWCCTIFRGFELSEDEKAEVRNDLKSRLEHNRSPYLINMANCFFPPLPTPPTLALSTPIPASTSSQPRPWWCKIFKWN
jgi:hypothetical protein